MTNNTELKLLLDACLAEKCPGPREFRKAVDALFDVCTIETISELVAENEALRKSSDRYLWLRDRDLETVHQGGVFAGQTPRNVVLSGDDLDAAIDAAMGKGKHS